MGRVPRLPTLRSRLLQHRARHLSAARGVEEWVARDFGQGKSCAHGARDEAVAAENAKGRAGRSGRNHG